MIMIVVSTLHRWMGVRPLIRAAAEFAAGILLALGFAAAGMAQTSSTPLTFSNNYFVTGDYVVGGVGLRGLGVNGYATGTITIPDGTYGNSIYKGMNYSAGASVPAGADIVAAFLYWQTVESSQTSFAGQTGFFRGYPITGVSLGNPNAPVSWSSGGCSGASNGSKTMRTYRADVTGYMPVDGNGNIQPNNSYQVSLADSGSNGGGSPLTLGATLVLIYRVLPVVATVPLKAVVIYDGSYAPSNAASTTTLTMQWIYEPTVSPDARLTHIAGNGQSNKYEQVLFNGNPLTPVNTASFPGAYNGSWDNPSWAVNSYVNAVTTSDPGSPDETTTVVPSSSNSGCVSWGAAVVSTTVQSSDGDGLLDVWKANKGYCDATYLVTRSCAAGTTSWVDLTEATPGKKDLFVQVDYMCSGTLNTNGGCDPGASGHSHMPSADAQSALQAAFSNHNINLHIKVKNAILEQTCTDNTSVTPPQYCAYPGAAGAGAIGWKYGFEFLKYAPWPTDTSTNCLTYGVCQRNFQYGRKDSYHYAVFGHSLSLPDWSFAAGTLTSVSVSSTGLATFTTQDPIAKPFTRVSVGGALSNPNLNGVFLTTPVVGTNTFSIQLYTSTATAATYSGTTDPYLMVASDNLRSGSGFSDIGGGDSLITLGQWGADGKTPATIAGTFMHELGHSLTLTHGGVYPTSATAALPLVIGPNCKPNYQSVMNYLFQVDLLGPKGGLDYSSQTLSSLDETYLPSSIGTTDGSAIAYPTSTWYDVQPPNGVGTAAVRHCDGTALLSTDPAMYRITGPVVPGSGASSLWSSGSLDINFDGDKPAPTVLNGFDDWANLDLRQIGATGGAFFGAGGIQLNSGGIQLNSGGIQLNSGGIQLNSGGIQLNSGGIQLNSGGIQLNSGGIQLNSGGEVDFTTANSTVRPPGALTFTPADTRTSHSAALSWSVPSFGQIASYNVYRGSGTTPISVLNTNYTDSAVTDCTTYTYFVTSILAPDGRQSPASNSVPYAVPCLPTGLGATQSVANNMGTVTLNWTAASTASGPNLGYKVYRVTGTDTTSMTLLTPAPVALTNYTDSSLANHTTYTYSVTTVPVDQTGCPGANAYCRESTQASVTITVQYKLPQTITFAQLAEKTYGDTDFAVSATASSGLAVSFSAGSSANCTLSGTTVHIVHAGSCTVTATQAGDADYYPAPDVPNTFTINKANATISVTGYSVTYDGNAHTATGTATGVKSESLSGLNLTGTTHTNAGTYMADAWSFTDATGNYNNASGTVSDNIAKANPVVTVVPYSVAYDGNAHTATGTATGVKGESLSGLNLGGTTHINAGTYMTDPWSFTDVTGNYNNASGTIPDTIALGQSITAITSMSPSPSVLGQSFTVNFSVSHASGIGTPSGSVTVSDVSRATCTGALTSGTGKCVLTLPESINGNLVVGTRNLTAAYSGDTNFSVSSGIGSQQVIYTFTGFYSPLSLAGDSSTSGAFNIGKSVTAKWNLQDYSGTYLGTLNANTLDAIGPVTPLANGTCPLPNNNYAAPITLLYSPTTGAKGNSTFRIATSNNQFIFNWDTTGLLAGCYALEVRLDSGQVERTALRLQ